MKTTPRTLQTPSPALNRAWGVYAYHLLTKLGFLIADTNDDLNYHAFLGHSVDMQGFRAGEFVGVDPMKGASNFVPLKYVEIGVRQLASLWEETTIRDHFLSSLNKYSIEPGCITTVSQRIVRPKFNVKQLRRRLDLLEH